ncbi:cellulase family glycosylhydrolase [Saccharicrinis aurantiacus]|uniref:cellulase family glycosylhydrolase n=1 Tax=Saccharicrinis aurantiacus TaxID=1849719 RepID=UPI002492AE94|nr:cellulase family glycosylhydrolase [Saccharicrinis aurantiacus]
MRKLLILVSICIAVGTLWACKDDASSGMPDNNAAAFVIKNTTPVSTNFIGNGAQWGGYDIIEDWTGSNDFNDADWAKMKKRIDFMRPPFIRIMIDANWNYTTNGEYTPEKSTAAFHNMLQYCTDNNITVMFGEWGHQFIDGDRNNINEQWLDRSIQFLDMLINERGYTCIKHYNMVNEPNGDWSSTNSDYNLWKTVAQKYHAKLVESGLINKVQLAGPDIAVFSDANATNWITRTAADFGDDMGMYEIHTYPTKSVVNGSGYMSVLEAYRKAAPAEKQIVMGEIGLKYYDADADLQDENQSRIDADKYASDDSNMFIYDGFYGVDVSDAIIQTMMAGFSGALVWDMDDAMYNQPEGNNSKKLKRWGFWNILGEEAFESAEDEELRPFYFPVSLLCRYFPAESNIYEVELPNRKGVRAVVAEKGGEYTMAIVNSHVVSYPDINIEAEVSFDFSGVSKFEYISKSDGSFEGDTDAEGFPIPCEENINIDFSNYNINVAAQSVIILTNMQ